MRTTLTIDDDLLDAARKLAAARGQSLGRVVSDLLRRGLVVRDAYSSDDQGFPRFEVREGSPLITLEDVKGDEDETD